MRKERFRVLGHSDSGYQVTAHGESPGHVEKDRASNPLQALRLHSTRGNPVLKGEVPIHQEAGEIRPGPMYVHDNKGCGKPSRHVMEHGEGDYLKEELRRVWNQTDKVSAKTILHNWIMEAKGSGIRQMKRLADTIELHSDGILAYYDYRISSGKVESVNNKIKTIKRQAYGFRDDDYFKLRVLSMHDDIYAKL